MKEISKRLLAGALGAVLLTSFVGCSSGASSTTPAMTDSTEPAASAPSSESNENPPLTELFTKEQLDSFAQLVTKYKERAGVISDATQSKYMTDQKGNLTVARYYTVLDKRPARNDVASVWHYTAFLSMASHLIAIADSDADRATAAELYAKLVDALNFYKGTTSVTTYTGTNRRTTFYGVNRASTKNGANVANELAVYDDQMWIIMDLMDAYSYTGEQAYMDEAVRLADICLSAWDVGVDAKGNEYGGITWGPAYATKHTCSNAPLISPLVDISNAYAAKGDSEKADFYLSWAKKVYAWTNSHLMNSRGVFGDLLGTTQEKDGDKFVTKDQSTSIDQTAYTYNSGTMLSGAAALYQATGDEKYLRAAEQLAKNTQKVFCVKDRKDEKPDSYPITSDTVWFNFILFQGYVDLANAELARAIASGDQTNMTKFTTCLEYVESMQASIDYAYDNYQKDGFLPRDFVNGWNETSNFDKSKNVMDQASASETYSLLAMFYEGLIETQQAFDAAGQS